MVSMWLIKIDFLMMNWAVNWNMWVNIMVWFVMVDMMRCSICIMVWRKCMMRFSMSVELIVMAKELRMVRCFVVWGCMMEWYIMVWSFMVRCFMMSPEVLIVWSSNMMGISVSIEASMVWSGMRESKEDLIVFLGGSNCGNNCTSKECSHLIKPWF